jgi:hypothetical protein
MGLREQIKNANSESEITSLLTQGKDFEFAGEYTKRAWKSAARVRLSQLASSGEVVQTSEKVVKPKKDSKKKKTKLEN